MFGMQKVTFGSRWVHLKWLVPFNVFVDLFQRCQEIKKTRTMFTVANCPEAFLHELFGIACLKKEICTGKEVVQAIFDTSSTTFKYIIESLKLHVTFSFRRYKRDGTVWREMEYAGEEASMISTTMFLNNAALEEIQVERSWTLLDVRHLLQRNECYPEDFVFFHLNKVEDAVPVMEDPTQERQGKGSPSQRPSNMEPLSDEAIILAEINEENKEDFQLLIRSVPLHAKIMLPRRSEEDCVFTLD
ncbi:hypothetical protein L7F22_024778 [Adiantum nelumboides]|nr:hypothetical protein [Adiantum nelumboides]